MPESVVPTPSTRVAVESDLDVLQSLTTSATSSIADSRGGALMLRRETPPPTDAALRLRLTNPNHRTLLGLLDDVPVGIGSAQRDDDLAMIDSLWVEPNARSVGVGEALLNALIEWARDQGCTSIDAYALPGERITKNFFEAAGMKARLLTVSRPLHEPS